MCSARVSGGLRVLSGEDGSQSGSDTVAPLISGDNDGDVFIAGYWYLVRWLLIIIGRYLNDGLAGKSSDQRVWAAEGWTKGGCNVNINEVKWLRAIGSEPWNRLFTKHLLPPWINQLRKQTQSQGVLIAWLYLDVRLLRPLTNGYSSSSMFRGLFGFPSTSGDVIDWHDKKIKIITAAKLRPFPLISLSRRRFLGFPVLKEGKSSSHHYSMNLLSIVRSQKSRRYKKFVFIFPSEGFSIKS